MYSQIISEIVSKLENNGILSKINNEGERLIAIDFLNDVVKEITDIDGLKFNVTTKKDQVYLLCKFKDSQGFNCKGGLKVADTLDKTLIELINLIINGQNMINKLNRKLEDKRVENGNILSVRYRWGNNKDGAVLYWDYTHVTLRINKDALDIMVSKTSEDEQEEYINNITDSIVWEDNPIEFLSKYNKSDLAFRLTSNIEELSIEELITKHMLSYEDIEEQVLNTPRQTGQQKLKSVAIVKELGLFAGIVIWDIDYEIKDISVKILDDRIIDIENHSFISDHSLFSRVEQRVIEQANSIKDKLSV